MNEMKTTIARTMFALWMSTVAACGAMYTPPDGEDGGPQDATDARNDARNDAPVTCRTEDGRVLTPGQSYSQACATCVCQNDGSIVCEGPGCADVVEPPVPCNSQSDCGSTSMCTGPEGCGVQWYCQPVQGCTADYAAFCMCDGTVQHGSSSCPPGPYAHRGECEVFPDAGPSCAGAFLDQFGNCLGPADGPLPAYCCAGMTDGGQPDGWVPPDGDWTDASVDGGSSYDCNPYHVVCDALPPPCPGGEVRTVQSGCWGECVLYDTCEPISCDPAGPESQCPQGLTCWGTTHRCGPFVF